MRRMQGCVSDIEIDVTLVSYMFQFLQFLLGTHQTPYRMSERCIWFNNIGRP
jgi:hypothetical protein